MKTIQDLFDIEDRTQIAGLAIDSRKVQKGYAFFCMPGQTVDGHAYAAQAAGRHAACIVHAKELESYDPRVRYIRVTDVAAAMNRAAARFYDNVNRKMKLYGVTGTNGKTTIACVMKDVLDHFTRAGYIGTIANKYNVVHDNSPHTTPDAITLHSILSAMYADGIRSAAMEVSSHGLEQRRVESIDFDVAVFTNLTHEHLDFHGTMENYRNAKAKLFAMLPPDKTAVINNDDAYTRDYLKQVTKAQVYTYGIEQPADYMAKNILLTPDHTDFTLVFDGKSYPVRTNLVAMFNVYNLLAAIAGLHEGGKGYLLEAILPCLQHVTQVQGRIECVDEGQDFHVIVDYAHTPDGFEKIYQYAEKIKQGHQVIAMFGSAGERDYEKRPILGAISDKYCDKIVLTEEDCRSEDPAEIARAIRQGITHAQCYYEPDRFRAIQKALTLARPGDVVLLLAKANEKFLDRDGHCFAWMGDIDAARQILHSQRSNGAVIDKIN